MKAHLIKLHNCGVRVLVFLTLMLGVGKGTLQEWWVRLNPSINEELACLGLGCRVMVRYLCYGIALVGGGYLFLLGAVFYPLILLPMVVLLLMYGIGKTCQR